MSQQPQRVLASASLQSPQQSAGKAITPGYPSASTPHQSLSIKTEPGLTPVADTSALDGTTISIKEETVTNTTLDVKPELNSAGSELSDAGYKSLSELDDGSQGLDIKSDPGLPAPAKAPVAKKGEHVLFYNNCYLCSHWQLSLNQKTTQSSEA